MRVEGIIMIERGHNKGNFFFFFFTMIKGILEVEGGPPLEIRPWLPQTTFLHKINLEKAVLVLYIR
jgi:hypothetical protein